MRTTTPSRLAALRAARGVGVVNLEGPIGTGPLSAQRLVNHPDLPAALVEVGVGVIGIANNHRDDLGAAGVRATTQAVDTAEATLADAGRPAVVTVGGRRVAVIAGQPADLERMRAALETPADLHLASLHVVAPPSYLPAPETRAVVDALIDAGARVVAVHGSHALGPVEWRRGALVAWGLGNLAFDCKCTREDEGMILELTLTDAGLAARVVPIEVGLYGAAIRPHPDAAGIITLLNGLGSRLAADGSVEGVGAQPDGEGDDVRR